MSADEPLRLRALAHLGRGAPEDAARALEQGLLDVGEPETSWSGSLGLVRGYLVTLHVDEPTAGVLRASVGSWDALVACVAAALAERPGSSLARLALGPPRQAPPGTPYR